MKIGLLLVTLFAFLSFCTHPIYAQETTLTIIPSPIQAVSQEESSYQLPYPGLLPDHPLYIMKTMRDNIIDFFIGNPLKKTEFYLLQADKRLVAGVMLYQKDKTKTEEVASVLSKSGNYFEKAIGQLREAKKLGLEIQPMLEKLIAASDKHREVLLKSEKQAAGADKKIFSTAHRRMLTFEKTLHSLQKIYRK